MAPRLRTPEFWWRGRSLLGTALAPLGALYGAVSGRRLGKPGMRVAVPVLCVGNFVVGGAGKTPTALAVATMLRELGLTPGFLSRGYGGSARGPVLVAPGIHNAGEVGDEALLLAAAATTVVSRDRPAGARLLAELDIDVIVMDDGFQNPSLTKDVSILVVDGTVGIGNGRVFPAGPLRAPLIAQLRKADALVVVGGSGGGVIRAAARAGLPIFRADLQPVGSSLRRKKPYLAFAGIGNPAKFFAGVEKAGIKLAVRLAYPDHHAFTDAECEAILKRAKEKRLRLVTTEKDRARLVGRTGAAEKLWRTTEVFPVELRFEEPRRFSGFLREALGAPARAMTPAQSDSRSSSSRSSDALASK